MFTVGQNKGWMLALNNGWTVSVQFGGGNYCDRRDAAHDASYTNGRQSGTWDSGTAEVAAWATHGVGGDHWYNFGSNDGYVSVRGYQTVEQVLDFINGIRALPTLADRKLETQQWLNAQPWR